MKLKTLKEIEKLEEITQLGRGVSSLRASSFDLRQEAKKRVKILENVKFTTHHQMVALECTILIHWIKDFFNIKDGIRDRRIK